MKKKYSVPRRELIDDLADPMSEMNEYLKILLDTSEEVSDVYREFRYLIHEFKRGERRKKVEKRLDEVIYRFQQTYDSLTNVQNKFTHITRWMCTSRELITKKQEEKHERRRAKLR